jgi:hypothetical protein
MFAELMQLEEGDVTKIAALFLLLDAWDRQARFERESCRACLIACNSSTGYFKAGPS